MKELILMLIIQEQVKFFQCSVMLLVHRKGKILDANAVTAYIGKCSVDIVIPWGISKIFYHYSEMKEIVGKQPKYPARLNPSNFGRFGHCYCMCEKPGQVGCPSRTALPNANKPKWWQVKDETDSG